MCTSRLSKKVVRECEVDISCSKGILRKVLEVKKSYQITRYLKKDRQKS